MKRSGIDEVRPVNPRTALLHRGYLITWSKTASAVLKCNS